MHIRKTAKGGGEGISNPKHFIGDLNDNSVTNFPGGKRNIVSRNEGAVVGVFPNIHPNFRILSSLREVIQIPSGRK